MKFTCTLHVQFHLQTKNETHAEEIRATIIESMMAQALSLFSNGYLSHIEQMETTLVKEDEE